ncbi:MAG: class I SAM-dependent methyltransferase [Chitinophagales bacterium]|nr:class I SAM-dependent methyltransferase [Chitinophagales bacterium]MDW8427798.1 class I SAM-dependent methyltransferase [Chitinophagales bacterium]
MKRESSAWYETWFGTPYYHVLYAHRDAQEADMFLQQLLPLLALPIGARVLDVGCGEGRHARVLARYGFEVMGIDLSEQNVLQASAVANDRLTFLKHDMRQLLHVHYFDAVFNLFTSFGYFDSDVENARVFHNMALALKDGGKLVLDFFNARYVFDHLVAQEELSREGITFFLRRRIEQGSKPVVVKEIVVHSAGSPPMQFFERVVAYERSDFEKWCEKSGLRLVNIFGSYRLEPFDERKSPRLILVAQRQIA